MPSAPADVGTEAAERPGLLPIRSDLHATRIAASLGVVLGGAFAVCFLTGVLSHLIQHPPGWFAWPSRPAGLYRVSQGLHVVTGFVAIPLLLAKLWVVADRFWELPPIRNVWHGIERLSLLPLVAGSIFMLVSGLFNVARWYPWAFFFPTTHYWVSWITIGGLVMHIGCKIAVTRRELSAPQDEFSSSESVQRRTFLRGVGATAAVGGLAVVGQTVTPLSRFSILGQRSSNVGPQGLPVQKSASQAGTTELARSPEYRLMVTGDVERELSLTVADLEAMDMSSATLPISCVEGWSKSARWSGIPLWELMAAAGAPENSSAIVRSLQPRGLYRSAEVNADHCADRDTLVALVLNGERLDIDHGYPVRLIGPNRPGVMQTKWLSVIEVKAP